MVARGTESMNDPGVGDAGDSTLQLVIDQLEELVVTVIEEIRERPGVVLAICAALFGVFVGSALAVRGSKRASPQGRVVRSAQRVGDMAELAGMGVRLLQNPIVRGLIIAAVERQLRRRVAM